MSGGLGGSSFAGAGLKGGLKGGFKGFVPDLQVLLHCPTKAGEVPCAC